MGKIKNIIMGILASCLAISASVGLAACTDHSSDFPDYKIPEGGLPSEGEEDDTFKGVYHIKTSSLGGLALDGIRVSAVKNGETIKSGISINGVIDLALDSDEYDLVVDESYLPEGYFVPEGTTYKTEKDKPNAQVTLSSAVIDSPASATTTYTIGSVMHDFSFTYVDGSLEMENGGQVRKTTSLKQALTEKKAVFLNFWYRSCSPCRREMPHMNSAYNAFKDKVALFALSTSDSMAEIDSFQQSYGYTFEMGPDVGIYSRFGLDRAPVTVIVDRYGVIASVTTGSLETESVWRALFAKYTDDNYRQDLNDDNGGENPPDENEVIAPPSDVVMAPEEKLKEILGGNGTDGKLEGVYAGDDDAFVWPYVVEHDDMLNVDVIASANATKGNSYSYMYIDFNLKQGDILSYDYYISTKADTDAAYVIMRGATRADDKVVKTHSGESGGWKNERALYIAPRDEKISVAFSYIKNGTPAGGNDFFWLKNFTIENIATVTTATDMIYDAAYNSTSKPLVEGKFNTYVEVAINPDDNYYHLVENGQPTGPLLLLDMLNVTPWTGLHCKGSTFEVTNEAGLKNSTLYNYAYWYMTNWRQQDRELTFTFNGKNVNDLFIESYYMHLFSDNGYLPVSEEVKEVVVDFLKEYHSDKYDFGGEFYEDEWLEFCFYYNHYGDKHADTEVCANMYSDPTKALSQRNAYVAEADTPNLVEITKIYNYKGGGIHYSYTAPEAGLYYIYSSFGTDTSANPTLAVWDEEINLIASFDDDTRYDTFRNDARDNFYGWIYLEQNQKIYLQCGMYAPGDVGTYYLNIEKLDEDGIDVLSVASHGGAFVSGITEDGELDPSVTKYLAIDAAIDPADGLWHAQNEDYSLGSKIYIDFTNPNFFTVNSSGTSLEPYTLYDLINLGLFNFEAYGGKNMSRTMAQYYSRSLQNEGELKGKIAADATIVEILNSFLTIREWVDTGTGEPNTSWLAFACYYQHYGK